MPNDIQNLNNLNKLNTLNKNEQASQSDSKLNFGEMLKDSLNEANAIHKDSEKALGDMATGQVKDLHQAAISIGRAETNMKMMLEVRNKAITAYKEILKTQI